MGIGAGRDAGGGRRAQGSRSVAGLRVSVVVLALAAAACGAGSTGETGPPEEVLEGGGAEAGETVTEATTGLAADTTGVEAVDEPETFAELLGYDTDDPDAAQVRAAADHRRFEEMVARCMADQGFEYVPAIRPVGGSRPVLDEEEFARERGFGITTWYGQETMSEPDEDEWVNPNEAVVAAMSESERYAYDDALYGLGEQRTDPDTGEQIFDESDGGCRGQSYDEVYGFRDEVSRRLGPARDEVFQRVLADSRFLEADRVWSECMADRGYTYAGVMQMSEGIFEDFEGRLDEITSPGGFVNPFEELTADEVAALSEDERNDLIEQAEAEAMAKIDQEALAALQQEERDLAVATLECGQKLIEVTEELEREYEGRFIRENSELIDELLS